ncbi:alpha/beta fold hydrolase [Roseomonas sp. OT10]|uniref:alpha/beta fold hydrolase n=1 Tax=Roseomonas cutis TaxID=2897332 RepID=UPI001E653A2C|nr:alpha/beta fold hydrolase [Roseomonas sp. OT10]UFN48678.1 alpha/beta fold hydrolase [Roseomonas sp. OT10]
MRPRRAPLPLHLGLSTLRNWTALGTLAPGLLPPGSLAWNGGSTSSSAAWQSWSSGWPVSPQGRTEARRLLDALDAAGHSVAELQAAVAQRLAAQDAALFQGLAAYQRHPYRRAAPERPVLWHEGASRLLDHGPPGALPGGGPQRGRPALLVVPSLVNRAEVLDLMPGHSLLGWLSEAGIHPLLLDWGEPGEVERGLDLTGWIAGRLEQAIAAAVAATGGPVVLAGYCMGGMLALAAALRQPRQVRGLALLATPWDFWAGGAEERARLAAALLPVLEPVLRATGALPDAMLQAMFASLDPFGIAAKFRAFAAFDPQSEAARHFVALEDWLNDGVPLPAPVAREALGGWYGANTPARGQWRVAGATVDPAGWHGPTFVAIPHRDRLVPPESARALADRLPQAVRHEAEAGHIGMVAGRNAEAALWRPLAAWLGSLNTPSRPAARRTRRRVGGT